MKSKLFNIAVVLSALLLSAPFVLAQKPEKEEEEPQAQVRTMAADPSVVITMCLASGNIAVVGGDKREVRVNTDDDAVVMLRRAENPAENPKANAPATRLEVLVSDSPRDARVGINDCRGTSDVELEVPRGAVVYVKTREGDLEVSDVAEVHAETSSGNIILRHVAKMSEAATVSGDISLEESNGRIRLSSLSGNLEAIGSKVNEPSDFLYAKTTSGDVRLEHVAQPRVDVSAITGELSFTGSLTRGGIYNFKTTTGDITLNMSDSVSFQLTARISQGGEVITDFPLKYTGGLNVPDVLSSGKLTGIFGSGQGAATLNLVSFSGTLRLRKM